MIPLSARIRRLASVIVGLVALHGCASHRVEPLSAAGGGPVAVRPGREGLVVGVPRGGRTGDTGAMAAEIARRTGFGLVVGAGSPLPGGVYEQGVLEAAQGPLRFYAEIHDDGRRPGCTGQIDIVTAGVGLELALRLRALAELIRDAYLRGNREVPLLGVLVRPLDPLAAHGPRPAGEVALRRSERALQITLPACPRPDWRDTYTAVLSDFLAEAAVLSGGR
jgi:hypothetical protein